MQRLCTPEPGEANTSLVPISGSRLKRHRHTLCMTKIMKLAVLIAILVGVIMALWTVIQIPPHGTGPHTKVRTELNGLVSACRQFEAVYSAMPSGSVAEVFQILAGRNDKRIPFVEYSHERMSTNGVPLDLWGTEYRIDFPEATGVVARSAGKDKTWGTSDDMMARK